MSREKKEGVVEDVKVVETSVSESSDSAEKARRKRIVEAYKKGNPVKASKKLLSKDGKTLITLDEWVKEA